MVGVPCPSGLQALGLGGNQVCTGVRWLILKMTLLNYT